MIIETVCCKCHLTKTCSSWGPDDYICELCKVTEFNQSSARVENGEALETNLIDSIDTIRKSIKIDNSIQWQGDFFNAKVISISELKSTIDSDITLSADDKHFKLAQLVQARFNHLKEVLFEMNEARAKIAAEQRAIQQLLNQLVTKLRAEVREQFKANDINYQPKESSKAPVIKVKMTAEDKMIENYSKMMKIPIEQARKLMKAGLKEAGVKCTCNESPGMCKLHAVS